jgi:tRNA(Ile)-lysidine synthase
LNEEGLEWREDASNQDSKYLRNRVRNELIPILQELSRGGIETRIQDLDKQSRLLEKDLEERYENCALNLRTDSGIQISMMQEKPEFLQREILIRFIRQKTGIALSYRQLEKIFKLTRNASKKWSFHLEGEWMVFCKNEKLFCERKVDN